MKNAQLKGTATAAAPVHAMGSLVGPQVTGNPEIKYHCLPPKNPTSCLSLSRQTGPELQLLKGNSKHIPPDSSSLIHPSCSVEEIQAAHPKPSRSRGRYHLCILVQATFSITFSSRGTGQVHIQPCGHADKPTLQSILLRLHIPVICVAPWHLLMVPFQTMSGKVMPNSIFIPNIVKQ